MFCFCLEWLAWFLIDLSIGQSQQIHNSDTPSQTFADIFHKMENL